MIEKHIAQLVDSFYAKARRDEILGPIFANAIGDRWDSHLATMRTFWSSVMLGSATYKGNPLAAHLGLPRLGPKHFERWLKIWRETASEVCGDQGALFVQRAEAIAGRLLSAIASGKPASDTVEIASR
jgi:hemoglobin